MISTREKGIAGEDKACAYLKNNGYEIIQRNFRNRQGEIDIIALKDEYLVFIEVKSLPNGTIDTLSAELNSIKQKKIIKTAKIFLQKYREYSNRYIRFDVLAIDVPVLDPVHHIVDAFSE